MNYLKKEGLIGETKFGTDTNLYDRKLDRHSHTICHACGKPIDPKLAISRKPLEEAVSRSQFEPETIEFTLRRLRLKCKAQKV